MSKINAQLQRYLVKRGVKINRYQKVSKLKEEVGELIEAIHDYEKKKTRKNHQHLKEELADVVIVAASLAKKYDFTIEDALSLKTQVDKGRNL